MLQSSEDWSTFVRLDQGNLVDFFTSFLSAVESDLYTQDVAMYQLAIRSALAEKPHSSFIGSLRQASTLVDLLETRLGSDGLKINLMKTTLRSVLESHHKNLSESLQLLVGRMNLVLNRRISCRTGKDGSLLVLVPRISLGLVEGLATILDELQKTASLCNKMTPSSFVNLDQNFLQKDQELAQSLGFSDIEPAWFHKHPIFLRLDSLVNSISYFCSECLEILDGVNLSDETTLQNFETCLTDAHTAHALLSMKNESQQTSWDHRRQQIGFAVFKSLNTLNTGVRNFADQLGRLTSPERETRIPQNFADYLQYDLLRRRVSKKDALNAIGDLEAYCVYHQTPLVKLLGTELPKINANFTAENGALIQKWFGDDQAGQTTDLKSRIRHAASDLSAKLGSLLVAVFFLASCGIKTPVSTSVEDLRPPLVFKEQPATPPVEESETTQLKTKNSPQGGQHP